MRKSIFVVFALVVISGLGWTGYMKYAVAHRYPLASLQEIAAGTNKDLPIAVDEQTRLDKVVASEGQLEQRFTLINVQKSDDLIAQLNAKVYPLLKTKSCSNQLSKNLYASGVTEAFSYSDMNGQHLATFKVGQNDCG